LSGLAVASAPGRPADFDAFAAGARGRSFATGTAFHHAFVRHGPGWDGLTLAVRSGADGRGPLVAALEGWVERRLGGAWLRAEPYGAPAGPLFSPGLDGAERLAAARLLWGELERLARAAGWIGGDLTYAGPAAGDPALRAPATLGAERVDISHVIDLAAGPEAWRASLRKRARQQFTKAERLGVSVEASDDPADLLAVHALHQAQIRAWGGREARPLVFYRTLLEAPGGGVRLWVARAGGAVVCGTLVFVDPEEGYVWWSGSGPEARRRVAFPYLLSRVVVECGCARLSLGFSNREERLTDFKEQMGAAPVEVPILELTPRPRTPYHALLAAARGRLRGRGRRVAEPTAP
jgi:hypothetical protein